MKTTLAWSMAAVLAGAMLFRAPRGVPGARGFEAEALSLPALSAIKRISPRPGAGPVTWLQGPPRATPMVGAECAPEADRSVWSEKAALYQRLLQEGRLTYVVLPELPPWPLPHLGVADLERWTSHPWRFLRRAIAALWGDGLWRRRVFPHPPDPIDYIDTAPRPALVSIALNWRAPWEVRERIVEAARRGASGVLIVGGGHPIVKWLRRAPLLSACWTSVEEALRLAREVSPALPAGFMVWVAADPNEGAKGDAILTLARRAALGAGALVTQPLFDAERGKAWFDAVREAKVGVPIIIGIPLAASLDAFDFWTYLIGRSPRRRRCAGCVRPIWMPPLRGLRPLSAGACLGARIR